MTSENQKASNLVPESARVAPRLSLAEEAADNLRELILLGQLAPGMAISERDLAAGLGISRTPLKEAFRVLEREGLIEYGPTRRPRVADPSLAELIQNLQVLGALEALAGELACAAATAAEISIAGELCERMRVATPDIDPLVYFRWDMTFHRTIVLACRNTPLIETHAQYNARLWRARFLSSKNRCDRDSTTGQHVDIASAFKSRNGPETGHQMRQHLQTTIVNITAILEPSD